MATHSPVLAAVPGANLLELGPWGIRPATWDDLSLVVAWRQFMRRPAGVPPAPDLRPGSAQPVVAQAYIRSAGCTRMPPGTSTGGDWTKVGIAACQASLPLAVW